MVDRQTEVSDHFIDTGAGTGPVLVGLGALVSGRRFLALTAVVAAVMVAPFVILGLAAVALAAPFYLAARVVRRAGRREQWRPGRGLGSRAPAGARAGAGTSPVVPAAHVH